MRYSLKQLAVFDAVASSGSVSQAADKLALTQSAASMALSQLEKTLGRPLFERQGRGLVLTHWGHWLRPRAKQLLFDAKEIELGFYDQHLISGEISVGASQTGAEHLVPDLISNLDREFPELRINVEVHNTEKVTQGVREFRYDLGIIEGRCDDSRLQQDIWCHDHLVIVASKHHPYAAYERVSLTQLEQAKWVLREPGSGTRAIFDAALFGVIDDLDVWREYEHVPVLRSLIANGPYISCLPYLDVIKFIESGEFVALNVPEIQIERPLSFVWRTNAEENPLKEVIIREAKRMIKHSRIKM
ncbi:LysR substrate-binding domain-containing protein [Pseudovibrio exalbescens]|uniref:LysR family transcriptional regulator n=1 Tax=Pseudovibrio exalbescens TaxID=197461 RepID=A0A1U7JJ66_9HYPH|nr:LysR substrate-binding domain-containing protein [Pseudovibrio exalbescens]OKL44745.1 LysR family transcriptional regulator [Pseudovibrio exalbescens]